MPQSKPRIWSKIGERVRRDFFFQAAAGSMPGVSVHTVIGFKESLGQIPGPISSRAYEYFTDYQPLSVVSDNVNDAYRGTGAWILRVLGLDYKHEVQMEDILLKGTTPVISQGEYIRVLDAAIFSSGTVEGATGIVTITGNNDAKLVGAVYSPSNRMLNGCFTIPAHTNGYVFNYFFGMGAPKETTVGVRSTTPGREKRNWIMNTVDFLYGGSISEDLTIPIYLPAITDVELVGYINVDSTTYLTGNMTIVLIDEAFEWDHLLSQDEVYKVTTDE